ncbi:MAG: glycosyltransferase family 39 protein [Bacteroidales bacterium]|nr:glycosyltransferase family 39 protein [Bacteroidales bacterium]MDZ4204340.1 glycosyltransferase family 39 protein [Bacteroidales bacterium]
MNHPTNIKTDRWLQLLIAAVAALVFIPFLGGVHLFDWDEINFAESAREMISSGDYLTVQIGFQPFWEKPPLFIWMQVLSMKIFGINEFAARFPNAICGIITLLVLYNFGKKLINRRFGLLWVMAYAASILPFFYFKSGIIDPWFNLFIFIGVSCFVFYLQQGTLKIWNLVLSATFVGLAIMTKGPVALLIFLLAFGVNLVLNRFRLRIKWYEPIVFALVVAVVGGFWFILQIINGKAYLIQDFIVYQIRLFTTKDSGHGGFLLYHVVILLVGVFPASVFAIAGHRSTLLPYLIQRKYRQWMIILLWVVLILYTLVSTKIIHYSSLAYFPLTFLAAMSLQLITDGEWVIRRWMKWLTATIGLIIAFIVMALPLIHWLKYKIIEADFIRDPFAKGNLAADVMWSGWEMIIGLVLVSGIIFFILYAKKRSTRHAFASLFGSSFLFVILTIVVVTPKIEGYSQRAAIEFFKSLSHKDVYVETLGYKSYAHWFYGKVQPHIWDRAPEIVSNEWLLNGKIDKDAYFSAKIHHKEKYMNQQPELQILYEKNGFVFFVRPRNSEIITTQQ